MNSIFRFLFAFIFCGIFSTLLCAQSNDAPNTRVISYQGTVKTNSGSLLSGDHLITTTLYLDANGTIPIWSGAYKQTINAGVFTVMLGSGASPLPITQDFSKPLWIGVKIDGGEELKPITQLTGAPYAVSIADKSVTKDKMAVDYVGSIMVNGKRITGKGKTLNLVDGVDTRLLYDETTNSLSLNSLGGIGIPTTQAFNVYWMTAGNTIRDPAPPNSIPNTFGSIDQYDVMMEAFSIEQMRMLGNQAGPPLVSTHFGLLIPASIANGTGVIFQGAGISPHTYIHSFGDLTNFFAGNDAGNLTMTFLTSCDGSYTNTDNTGVGYKALNSLAGTGCEPDLAAELPQGARNTAFGSGALTANKTGWENTAVGYWALYKSQGRSKSTAIGACALENDINGHDNVATGWGAMANNDGNYNTGIGNDVLYNNLGDFNTGCGIAALQGNTTGSNNTATGAGALGYNTIGSNNTAVGYQSLYNNTYYGSNENTAIGSQALYSNDEGTQNTASGYQALYNNTRAYGNTASGYQALYSNTIGNYNTASGMYALYDCTGYGNTASGFDALDNTTGDENTALGSVAGFANTTGSNNTFVGYSANASTSALTNATAIGNGAVVSASNTIQLGNNSVTLVNTSGAILTPQLRGAGANKYAQVYTLTGGAASEVINNTVVTASSVITATMQVNANSRNILTVVPAAGSFTVTCSGVIAANDKIMYIVVNP